jgi:hypothetical protein
VPVSPGAVGGLAPDVPAGVEGLVPGAEVPPGATPPGEQPPAPAGQQGQDGGTYITVPQERYDPVSGQMVPVMVEGPDGNMVQQSAMYELDGLGRTVRAEMNDVSFVPKDFRERDAAAQEARSGDSPADHAGHFIASVFGGAPSEYNMAPMQGNELNLSNYKRLENEIKSAAQAGKTVDFAVQAVYEGESPRPSHFNTIFTIDGERYAVTFVNHADQPRLYDRNAPPTEW